MSLWLNAGKVLMGVAALPVVAKAFNDVREEFSVTKEIRQIKTDLGLENSKLDKKKLDTMLRNTTFR